MFAPLPMSTKDKLPKWRKMDFLGTVSCEERVHHLPAPGPKDQRHRLPEARYVGAWQTCAMPHARNGQGLGASTWGIHVQVERKIGFCRESHAESFLNMVSSQVRMDAWSHVDPEAALVAWNWNFILKPRTDPTVACRAKQEMELTQMTLGVCQSGGT